MRPTPYSVPDDGPVAMLLRVTERHAWRPVHLPFMITAPGQRLFTVGIVMEGDRYPRRKCLAYADPMDAASFDLAARDRLNHPFDRMVHDFRL